METLTRMLSANPTLGGVVEAAPAGGSAACETIGPLEGELALLFDRLLLRLLVGMMR